MSSSRMKFPVLILVFLAATKHGLVVEGFQPTFQRPRGAGSYTTAATSSNPPGSLRSFSSSLFAFVASSAFASTSTPASSSASVSPSPSLSIQSLDYSIRDGKHIELMLALSEASKGGEFLVDNGVGTGTGTGAPSGSDTVIYDNTAVPGTASTAATTTTTTTTTPEQSSNHIYFSLDIDAGSLPPIPKGAKSVTFHCKLESHSFEKFNEGGIPVPEIPPTTLDGPSLTATALEQPSSMVDDEVEAPVSIPDQMPDISHPTQETPSFDFNDQEESPERVAPVEDVGQPTIEDEVPFDHDNVQPPGNYLDSLASEPEPRPSQPGDRPITYLESLETADELSVFKPETEERRFNPQDPTGWRLPSQAEIMQINARKRVTSMVTTQEMPPPLPRLANPAVGNVRHQAGGNNEGMIQPDQHNLIWRAVH